MMKLEEVATGVYACLQQGEGTTLGWSNSGFIDHGGGLVVDTFWDKRLTARLLELYADVNPRSPRTLINTHHNVDHTGGNGLLAGAKIIAHRDCPPAIERETAAAEMFKALVAADSSKLSPAQADLANELRPFDLDAVEPRLPDTLVDDRMLLDLDGLPVEIEHLGPAHTDNDLIVHLPEQRVVFTGDLLFWRCAPIGWSGTTAAWVEALDTIEALDPEVVVPGHGPVCGLEGVRGLREYFNYIVSEARGFYEQGLSPLEASKRIDLGPFADWEARERLVFNVHRAYREFRGESEQDVDFADMIEQSWQLKRHLA